MRCTSVRSSRINILWKPPKRTRMLASEPATASRSSRVTRYCGASIFRALGSADHYNENKALNFVEKMISKIAEANFPTRFGHFRIYGFEGVYDDSREECVVLRMGKLDGEDAPLLRIHSQCLTGDVFHSLRCDCRSQLERSEEHTS